jgi:uncharacterized protein (DUF1800 family)
VPLLLLAAGHSIAAEPTAVAVEYFAPALGHYFFTSGPDEIASVDSGRAGNWVRTGGQFGTFAGPNDAPGLSPVCRFYGTPGVGPNSHFYTANADECAQVKTERGWTYEGIAFYIQNPVNGTCPAGTVPIYRSYNNGAARNDSNHRYTVDYTVFANSASTGYQPEGVSMCSPLSTADLNADAVRLLRQATFGPTEVDVQHAASVGASTWLDEQFSIPATQYPTYAWMPANRPDSCVDDRTLPVQPDSYCNRDNYSLFPLQLRFFQNALAQPDQLRQRMAFALSQIMVASGVENARNFAMRDYQQAFLDRAFGNFYDLLVAVTLSPVMGEYLNMVNNNKSNPTAGTDPNENYGREILQLFSVGTYLLNQDGTQQLDATGLPLTTYDQAQVKGFARVFTGWTYPTVSGATPRANNPRNYLGNMLAVDSNHEFGTKVLLGSVVAPANMTMAQDLQFAHENIFNHPNVGPFIGKQLIQKLVTSNPTPGYVSRVSAIFANNGAGQRGDLRAVVRAILLDPEARGARKIDPAYGKLQEPVLFMTGVARALTGYTDGVFFRAQSSTLSQFVFYAPSVFNFYPFDYVIPGTQLLGPEFGLQTGANAVGRANFANSLIYSNSIAADQTVYGSTGTTIDLSAYTAVASNAGALADRIDRNLLAGRMSTAMRNAIISAVNAASATDAVARTRAALWLVVSSPQYQVQR